MFVSLTVEMRSLKYLLLMVLFQLTFSATKNSFWTKRSTFLTQQNQNRTRKIEREDLLRSFLKKSFQSYLKKNGDALKTEAYSVWFLNNKFNWQYLHEKCSINIIAVWGKRKVNLNFYQHFMTAAFGLCHHQLSSIQWQSTFLFQ